MPTISQLKYIIAVDRFRHFGQAARYCQIAQPSLSIQVQKVEDELNIVLFDRMRKPIQVTDAGHQFIQQARVILREHDKLLSHRLYAQSELQGELIVGIIPTVLPYLLPLFVANVLQELPKIKLVIEEKKTEDIIRDLHHDALDFGILATPLNEKGIREKPLFHERFVVYGHPDHPLLQNETVAFPDLPREGLWLLKEGHCLRNQVNHLCSSRPASQSISANFRFEGDNLETLRLLIKQLSGFTLLPWSFARTLDKEEQRQCIREIRHPAPVREVSFVYTRTQWKKKHMEKLRSTILNGLPQDLKALDKQAYVVPL